jgi:hypothetical protein
MIEGGFRSLFFWKRFCPQCGSHNRRRSRRRGFERGLTTVIFPYRCERCGQRWYRFRAMEPVLDANAD